MWFGFGESAPTLTSFPQMNTLYVKPTMEKYGLVYWAAPSPHSYRFEGQHLLACTCAKQTHVTAHKIYTLKQGGLRSQHVLQPRGMHSQPPCWCLGESNSTIARPEHALWSLRAGRCQIKRGNFSLWDLWSSSFLFIIGDFTGFASFLQTWPNWPLLHHPLPILYHICFFISLL